MHLPTEFADAPEVQWMYSIPHLKALKLLYHMNLQRTLSRVYVNINSTSESRQCSSTSTELKMIVMATKKGPKERQKTTIMSRLA